MLREGSPYNDPLGALRAVPDASGVFRLLRLEEPVAVPTLWVLAIM